MQFEKWYKTVWKYKFQILPRSKMNQNGTKKSLNTSSKVYQVSKWNKMAQDNLKFQILVPWNEGQIQRTPSSTNWSTKTRGWMVGGLLESLKARGGDQYCRSCDFNCINSINKIIIPNKKELRYIVIFSYRNLLLRDVTCRLL